MSAFFAVFMIGVNHKVISFTFPLQTLLTSTELYKFIGIEAIKDDKFLNLVGALGKNCGINLLKFSTFITLD